MNHSKQLLTVLCCFVAFSLFSTNYTFAQGQGNGKGQGLLNNTGCANGKGFTTGQGHLKGTSAVVCGDPCLDEAINQVAALIQNELGGIISSTTITGYNTFLIFWFSGRDGRS